ncbi:MAG: RodZ domain-containing protein [Geminicoccaceae bacterium]
MPSRRPQPTSALREDHDRALQAVGRELRAARLARGEDLDDTATYLRIKAGYLWALEEGDLAAMPEDPYARGFLRTYGDHLGLDGKTLVGRLKPAVEIVAPRLGLAHRAPLSQSRQPTAGILVAAVVLLAAVYAGYQVFLPASDGQPAEIAEAPVAAPPVTDTELPASLPAPAIALAVDAPPTPVPVQPDVTSAVAAESTSSPMVPVALVSSESGSFLPTAVTNPTGPKGRVVLVARENSWIQIRSPDRAFVRTRTLLAGERFVVPEREGLALWTGNAGGIEIEVDGRSQGFVGASGAVVRNLPLAPASLVAQAAVTR